MRSNKHNNENESNGKFDLLDSIVKEENFVVPRGYFKELETTILEKTKDDIVSLQKRPSKWRIIATLAAAVVLGFLVLQYSGAKDDCKDFACLFEKNDLSKEEIKTLEEDSEMTLFDFEDEELF